MLADRLNDAVRNARAVGAVAGTLHKGSREDAAAGAAFPGHAMTPQTPVRIASITKPMVAMAVFAAFRTELDALDAPLSEHFADLKPVRQARTELSPAAMGHRYGLGWFLNSRADLIYHFGDMGGFQGLLAVAPDHGTAATAIGNDEHGGALSRAVVFREIANRTGLQRPRPAPKRLAYEAIRRVRARVLA